LLLIAFFNVEVIESCPTTISNVAGLYLRAETIKLSIFNREYELKFYDTNIVKMIKYLQRGVQ